MRVTMIIMIVIVFFITISSIDGSSYFTRKETKYLTKMKIPRHHYSLFEFRLNDHYNCYNCYDYYDYDDCNYNCYYNYIVSEIINIISGLILIIILVIIIKMMIFNRI
jgi:hypothetical protein